MALLPVMEGDTDGVRMMQWAGVNYSKLKYRGITAAEFARQTGNEEMLEALGQRGATL